jgi:hypothetical protein
MVLRMITCVWKLESPLGELYRSGSIIPRRLSIGIFLLVGRGASTGPSKLKIQGIMGITLRLT